MADEPMSKGELEVRFDGIYQRLGGIDARLDRMLPTETFALAERHTAEKLTELDRDCRERVDTAEKAINERFSQVNARFKQRDQHGDRSWTRVLAVAAIATSLVAALIGYYATTKGIK